MRSGARLKSWAAHGDGAADLSLDRTRHRLFVGTRIPAELTVYDSHSGKEIVSLAAPETMDGVHYDAELKRIYVSGGRWYATPPVETPLRGVSGDRRSGGRRARVRTRTLGRLGRGVSIRGTTPPDGLPI